MEGYALFWILACCTSTLAEICLKSKCQFRLELGKQTTMTYQSPDGTLMVKTNGTGLQLVRNELYPNAPEVGDFVDPTDVISADGFVRDVITINGQFPGPTIEVLKDAEVEIIVFNNLFTEAATIHYHGLYQAESIWMDGVPGITQHAILPGHSFTHRFTAQPVGTHWYHSHYSNQRLDGLFGMVIVHEAPPTLPYFVLSVMDWYHVTADHMMTTSPFKNHGPAQGYAGTEAQRLSQDGLSMSSLNYVSGLINGRGRYNDEKFPLSDFKLVPGKENVFKMCHTGAEFPWEISIDEHILTVSAMGADQIIPTRADFLIIYPGECYDFVIIAQSGNFWFRAKILQDPRLEKVPEMKAILHDGDKQEPASKERSCTASNNCIVFNCPFKGYADQFHRRCITVDQVRTRIKVIPTEAQPTVHFLNFGFQIGASINAHQWVNPAMPMFCKDPMQYTQCPQNCSSSGCHCPYTLTLTEGTPAILVLSNVVYSPSDEAGHHSIHLHGHLFEVLQAGYPEFNQTTGHWTIANLDVQCRDPLCSETYWSSGQLPDFHDHVGPVKDTVVVPAFGYVIVRLRVLNPGFWLMHCHQELHLDEGMILQLYVEGDIPEIPDPNVYEWMYSEPTSSTSNAIHTLTNSEAVLHGSSASASSIPTTSLFIIIPLAVLSLVIIVIIAIVSACRNSSSKYGSVSPGDEISLCDDSEEELLPTAR